MRSAFTLPLSLVYTLILIIILFPLVAKGVSILTTAQAERVSTSLTQLTLSLLTQPADTSSLTQLTLPHLTSSVKGRYALLRAWRVEKPIIDSIILSAVIPRDAWLITIPISIPYQAGMLSILQPAGKPVAYTTDDSREAREALRELEDLLPPTPTGEPLIVKRAQAHVHVSKNPASGWWYEPLSGSYGILHTPSGVVLPALSPAFILAARTDEPHAAVAVSRLLHEARLTTRVLKEKAGELATEASSCNYTALITPLTENEKALTTLITQVDTFLTEETQPEENIVRNAVQTLSDNHQKILAENDRLLRNACPTLI